MDNKSINIPLGHTEGEKYSFVYFSVKNTVTCTSVQLSLDLLMF